MQLTAPLSISPLVLNGLPVNTFATPNMINMTCDGIEDRILVLVQLNGGNDGINTLVPLEQYDAYRNLRPGIGLAENGTNGIIPLDSTLDAEDQVGLHPMMTGIKDLYDQGKVNIIQGVSYNNQNRSHFKSTDLWMSGGDGTPEAFNYDTGWMGRYLNYSFPGLAGNPTPINPDPLGIQLGSSKPSLGFHTSDEHDPGINLSGQDLSGFFTVVNEIGGAPIDNVPQSEYGDELQYIMNIENSVSNYAQRITDVFNAGNNAVDYPSWNLANQLKTVARLIQGGSKTKVFLVNQGGFDTHAEQVVDGSPHMGWHADLMAELSESIKAFQDDLAALGHEDKVLTVTFSEFGRKPIENGDLGTDHGIAAPMLLFGSFVQPGMTGTNVDLINLNGDQLASYQYDYRQVYTSLLQDWLGASDDTLTATYFDGYIGQKLPIIAAGQVVDPSCYLQSPLPVNFLHFQAKAIENEFVLVEWSTSFERNNDFFEIERSSDGQRFKTIGRVAGTGFEDTQQDYEFEDTSPLLGLSYYRLRQVDFDGRENYSEIRAVEIVGRQTTKVKLYPNPARFDAQLAITTEQDFAAQIRVFDSSGRMLRQMPVQVSSGFNKFGINLQELAAGRYSVVLEGASERFKEVLPLVVIK